MTVFFRGIDGFIAGLHRGWARPRTMHLPADVRLPDTNSRPSSIGGWLQHSRRIAAWGRDVDPASGWLAHVRSVVGDAR